MILRGLQKLTLLDYPGETACTIFTGGCNFKCPFCHNFHLLYSASTDTIDGNELIDFLLKRQNVLSGVVISGGEPTLNDDLPAFFAILQSLGFKTKLDTNGTNPDMIDELLKLKLLDYIAMDIKNSFDKYEITSGVKGIDLNAIKRSIKLIKGSSIGYEFRTTVVKELHEKEDFERIGEAIFGADNYYLQPFIDRPSVPFSGLHAPSKESLSIFKEITTRYVSNCQIRGEIN